MKRRRPPASKPRTPRRRPLLAAGTAAILVLAGLLWLLWPRDPYALPGGDWRLFKKRFLDADGRIVDDGNGGVTHTEGQGYGMLLAAAFHDRAAFDRIWNWTSTHLKRKDDFLFSWIWKPENGGAVGDPNNATDGDLLIAWALLRGFHEWGDYKYKQAAGQIVITILEKATAETHLGLQFLPGIVGFQKPEGVIVNASYCIFPALDEIAMTFPSDKWKPLHDGGVALMETARFGTWNLAPDWTLIAPTWVDLAPGHEAVFGYNAIRVPLYIAWADPASPLLAPFANFWKSPPAAKWDPATVNLQMNTFGPYEALPGMLAVRELALACAKKTKLTVAAIPRLQTEESYYSASLKLLVKVAIRERFAPKRN